AERKLEDLKAARVALGGRIRKAIIELGKARAAVPRAKAKKLQAELDKHNARTAELLFALQDHAGCRYEAVLRPAGGTIYSGRGEMHFPREEQQVPKSIQLENELARLYAEAAGFEARAAQNAEGGLIQGRLEELLAISDNPELIAPTRESIAA